MAADAAETLPPAFVGEELDAGDHAKPALPVATGDHRRHSEKHVVDKAEPDQLAHHVRAALAQDDAVPASP
jgi:hypothetical protein